MPADATHDVAHCLEDGVPNWEQIFFEVHCARCEYNLRSLIHPRCPECGLEFDWSVALARAVSHGEGLFEQEWRLRPIRSGLHTLGLTFTPRRFWSRVSLHEPVRTTPLYILLAFSLILFLGTLHGGAWMISRAMAWTTGIQPVSLRNNCSAMSYQYDRIATWPFIGDWRYLHVPMGWMLGVFGATVLLLSIHQTWNRYRLRPTQALRVAAYVAPPLALYAAMTALMLAVWLPVRFFSGPLPFFPHAPWQGFVSSPSYQGFGLFQAAILMGGQLLFLSICAFYLAAGLSLYLHIARGGLVAMVTVIVAALFTYAMLACFGLLLAGLWR